MNQVKKNLLKTIIEINLTHLHSKIEDGFQYTIEIPIYRRLSVLIELSVIEQYSNRTYKNFRTSSNQCVKTKVVIRNL